MPPVVAAAEAVVLDAVVATVEQYWPLGSYSDRQFELVAVSWFLCADLPHQPDAYSFEVD